MGLEHAGCVGWGAVPTRSERERPTVIREIEIEGFKSIDRLKLELGRVTVLIGENGCGKSNILEAIAFASAACADRLSHEFLASRGMRPSEPALMQPLFAGRTSTATRVQMQSIDGEGLRIEFLEDVSSTVPKWKADILPVTHRGEAPTLDPKALKELEGAFFGHVKTQEQMLALVRDLRSVFASVIVKQSFPSLEDFVVFSPENTALRTFEREGQILPIGVSGEGLFAHLRTLERAGNADVLGELNRRLRLIDWFAAFEIPSDLGPGEHRLSIRDRYLPDVWLDQRSANEGFLFLLFYYTLLLSPDTPSFFAIDNIDASLNPRLCARLMKEVVELAKARDKQVVVTTHNPAVLDGLNLADDEQRLVVVSRTQRGTTRARRIPASRPIEGAPSQRLSEAFIRGFLGGLPDNF